MAEYRLSNSAKEDLIRIHHFGVEKFGIAQADKYFDSLFDCFEIIAQRHYSFESVETIKEGYRRCPCGTDTIYYRMNGQMIEIMAIVGMQDLKNLL
ncbi:MAG TPA: type II toxin-antitoxin system RelE/ParE family toxin [Prolixibacteraceae bacterium]|jgi:toxin ParE1/3/4|nr:type II toxin-antitoxin system RelE/ParE family toxin [Prolixibacteraceae bacterium]